MADDYVIVQTAGDTYVGTIENQTYSINPFLINSGDVITIIDQGGTNTIELVGGLSITSSVVTSDELQLTLSNGAIVNVRGANTFTFDVGANQSSGTTGTQQNFEIFVTNSLGLASVPTSGVSTGGSVDIVAGGSITSYSWFEEEWSSCRGLVGTNSADQTRTVTCKDSDGLVVSDSYCTIVKPNTTNVCTVSHSDHMAYGYLWKKADWDISYTNPNNTVVFDESTQKFTLTASFQEVDRDTEDSVDERSSKVLIKAGENKTKITGFFADIKPMQINTYSKIQPYMSINAESCMFFAGITIRNDRIYIYGGFDNEDGTEYKDYIDYDKVDTQLASFPEGINNKEFNVGIKIIDNTIVFQVIDLDTNAVYSKNLDFATDIDSEAAAFYQSLTGEIPSIEGKTAKSIRYRAITDFRYGSDASLGTSTVIEVDDIYIIDTLTENKNYIDAYGYRWENYKYTRGDARYFGDENTVSFDETTNVFTLKAGFKETDADTTDSVDERYSVSAIRIKDFDNPITSVNADIKPIQMNPYSKIMLTTRNWNEEKQYNISTSLDVVADGETTAQ